MDDLLGLSIGPELTIGDLITLDFLLPILANLGGGVLILLVALVVSGWLRRRIRAIGVRNPRLDATLFDFLGALARYAVLTLAAVFILNRFGVQTASLVALIGAAGLAIGLALQGVLTSMAAGVMLILFRPFNKGDFIEVGGSMGTVKDMSLLTTELATLANVQVILPNSVVWGAPITNYSVYDTRMAELTFGVAYGADLRLAERIIRETLAADPRTLAEPEPLVQVKTLGESSVDILVRVWCASADYFRYQGQMQGKVKEALDAGGVEIPFPSRTLFHRDATPPSAA